MSELGQKPRFGLQPVTSGLPPTSEIPCAAQTSKGQLRILHHGPAASGQAHTTDAIPRLKIRLSREVRCVKADLAFQDTRQWTIASA